jgi:N-acetyl-gamma-glutamylphosphate reductase
VANGSGLVVVVVGSSGGSGGGKKKEVVVAITGASGMVGQALIKTLTGQPQHT